MFVLFAAETKLVDAIKKKQKIIIKPLKTDHIPFFVIYKKIFVFINL